MTIQQQPNSFRTGPDEQGRFGLYGGRFVAETLMPLILDLERAYNAAKNDPAFRAEMDGYLKNYVGRPSPLYFAERLTPAFRWRENLPQARGPEPHRRPQGEQRARPDHAGEAHGQATRDRRDRRRHARRRDRGRVDGGCTVLVSSHLLAELALSADSVVIIKGGRLVTQGSVAELVASGTAAVRVRTPQAEQLRAALTARGVPSDLDGPDQVVAYGVGTEVVGQAVAEAGVVVYEMSAQRPDLEDAFLTLTADQGSAS